MKCPVCQAVLLPVTGELFCLQCGEAVQVAAGGAGEVIRSEDTLDPLLRRALWDATDGEILFNQPAGGLAAARVDAVVPKSVEGVAKPALELAGVAAAPQKHSGHTFLSLRAWMAPARHPLAPAGSARMATVGIAPSLRAETAGAETAGVEVTGAVVPQIATTVIEKGMAKAWLIGLAGLGLFVGINLGVGAYYAQRVYPGVHVGSLAVGGWTFAELHQRLPERLSKPALTAVVGAAHYDLDLSSVGAVDVSVLERNVRDSGRSTALPVAGVIGSWFAGPVSAAVPLRDETLDKLVQRLAVRIDRAPSDAVVMVNGTDVLVVADKSGVKLDTQAAAEAIRAAYGHVATASVSPARLTAKVKASDYANDAAIAQAIITTGAQITVKKAHYSPTPGQIASWMVFLGPGKGAVVDAAGVAAFVTTIPGSFDRKGTVNGVVAALNARKGANILPSTKKPTGNPSPASIAAVGSVINYNYCIDESKGATPELGTGLVAALGASGSWTLGGKIHYTMAKTGCNFTVRLAEPSTLAALDSACEKQTTCRIHNDLAIATQSWAKAPAGWVGTTSSYRAELVNHVVGQWLGFEHPSCGGSAAQAPVLSTPSVLIGGCSPKWYVVPAELQDTKILPGF